MLSRVFGQNARQSPVEQLAACNTNNRRCFSTHASGNVVPAGKGRAWIGLWRQVWGGHDGADRPADAEFKGHVEQHRRHTAEMGTETKPPGWTPLVVVCPTQLFQPSIVYEPADSLCADGRQASTSRRGAVAWRCYRRPCPFPYAGAADRESSANSGRS